HRPPGALCQQTAPLNLTWSMDQMLCPMVTRSRQLRPRTFPPWSFLGTVCRNDVTPTRTTHGTGPSHKLSNIPYLRPIMVLPILVGMSGNVAAGTHVKPVDGNRGTIGEAISGGRAWRSELRAVPRLRRVLL